MGAVDDFEGGIRVQEVLDVQGPLDALAVEVDLAVAASTWHASMTRTS
ncbi:hypothetical protein ACWEHA_23360 [Amycolatopsis nivea]